MDNKKLQNIIHSMGLLPHPEGGYYQETYRDDLCIALPDSQFVGGRRNAATAIHFLLPGDSFSTWHRIKSDEIWHFCSGASLTLYCIDSEGHLSTRIVGNSLLEKGAKFHQMVPKGHWFAARPNGRESYSLVTCTVSPGFDFRDFQIANTTELIQWYPEHTEIIEQFSRPSPDTAL